MPHNYHYDCPPVRTEDNDTVVVYTHGSSLRNGQHGASAGVGVFWNYDHPDNVTSPLDGRAASNRAEIQAAVTAMKIAAERGYDILKIVTNSDYLVKGATVYIYKFWLGNGWRDAKGKPVVNRYDWQMLLEEQENFEEVKWQLVFSPRYRGKNNRYVEGSNEAYQLAREGAEMARNGWW